MANRFISIALALLLIISVFFNLRQIQENAENENRLLADMSSTAYDLYIYPASDDLDIDILGSSADRLYDRVTLYNGKVDVFNLGLIALSYSELARHYNEFGIKPEINQAYEGLRACLVDFADITAEAKENIDKLNRRKYIEAAESSYADLPWEYPTIDYLYDYITGGSLKNELIRQYGRQS